jgi:hypothetical protein
LYRYVGNAPTAFIDANGLEAGSKLQSGEYNKLIVICGSRCTGEWPTGPKKDMDWGLLGHHLRDIGKEVVTAPFIGAWEAREIIGGILVEPYDWYLTARGIRDEPRNPFSYAGFLPGIPSAVGRHCDELTGQLHHAISKSVHRALDRHQNLKGLYKYRDPLFTTRAIDLESHRGYQRWHRDLDKEVANWIRNNPGATQELFEDYLRNRYNQDDLRKRFPLGLP